MGICIYFAEALTAVAILHALEVRVWLWQLTEILSTALPTRWPTVSLLSWTFLGFLIWAYLYMVYYRMVQMLLKRMELIEPHRSLLVETFWKAGFLCCSVTYFILKLILDHGTNVDVWLPELVKQNLFYGNDPITPCSKKYFGLYCAFYVHDMWMTTCRRGFNLASTTKLFFYLFVLSTHLMRCVKAAYLFVFLMNVEALPACGAAVFVLFDRPGWRGALRMPSVWVISRILFAAHVFVWATNVFFLLPVLLLYPAVTTEVRQPDVLPLIALNATLWAFYCLNFVTSPTCRLIYLYLKSPTLGVKHRLLLDAALFPPETDVIKELQRIREEVRATRNRRAREAGSARRSEHHGGSVTACRGNLKLYQTIKCVMAVKRRLKRQRELQQALEDDESSESTTTTTSPASWSPTASSPSISTPDTPVSPDTPVPPSISTLDTPVSSDTPVPPSISTPDTPVSPDTPIPPSISTPDTPVSPDTPIPPSISTPDTPVSPDTPIPPSISTPDTPVSPDTPIPPSISTPDTPVSPDNPIPPSISTPDTPVSPDAPVPDETDA